MSYFIAHRSVVYSTMNFACVACSCSSCLQDIQMLLWTSQDFEHLALVVA